jgi:hexosaminidase
MASAGVVALLLCEPDEGGSTEIGEPERMTDRLSGLVPQPVTVRAAPGGLAFGTCPDIRPADAGAQTAAAAVRQLLSGLPWPLPYPADGERAPRCTVGLDGGMDPDAYRLAISADGVAINAGDTAGAIYAVQTIRQLLPDAAWRRAPLPATAAGWELPCADVEDRPALAWRGAHLDVARHFMPKRELLALIDALAALKLNRLHLHLTDDQGWRIESRLHPALHEIGSHRPRSQISLNSERPPVYDDIPHGGYYALDDLAEIAAYAGQRGMAVVPEIDLPGHSTALLAAVPALGSGDPPDGGYQVSPNWGIFDHLVAPLPATMSVLRDVLGEVIAATGARYVHIGGDECVLDRWRRDPRIEAARHDRGLASAEELHAAFLKDVADVLADDFAVRAVVWDEGFTSPGGAALRPDTVVMAWRGMRVARAAAEAGHDVIAAPVLPTYFDYAQDNGETEPLAIGGPVQLADVAGFEPLPDDWPQATRDRLIGTQFQVWTEYIPDGRALEYMIFPRACAFAEVAWSGRGSALSTDSPDRAALVSRIEAHLRRLDAAGLEYRPLTGPRPWQQGGAGPRRHRPGYRVEDVAVHLGQLAAADGGS